MNSFFFDDENVSSLDDETISSEDIIEHFDDVMISIGLMTPVYSL